MEAQGSVGELAGKISRQILWLKVNPPISPMHPLVYMDTFSQMWPPLLTECSFPLYLTKLVQPQPCSERYQVSCGLFGWFSTKKSWAGEVFLL